jgi:hypothetical protein
MTPLGKKRIGVSAHWKKTKAVLQVPKTTSAFIGNTEKSKMTIPAPDKVVDSVGQLHIRRKKVNKLTTGSTSKRRRHYYFVAKHVYVDTSLCEL